MQNNDKYISIDNATHNNLNLSIKIPKNKLVIITGLSGSGKTSLVFDVIHAEAQRRYNNSLPPYIKQFIPMYDRPEVSNIKGLSPTIAITQNKPSYNPRSTVSTTTDLYDYIRLLFARIGIPHSPTTGEPIKAQSISEIRNGIMSLPLGSRINIVSNIIKNRKGEHQKEIYKLQQEGFIRFKINNKIYNNDDLPKIDGNKHNSIDVIIDRLIIKDGLGDRLNASIETGLEIGKGIITIDILDKHNQCVKNIIFSEKYACPESGFAIEKIEPNLFSFNSPNGACPKCQGIGKIKGLNEKLFIDHSLSIAQGAIIILEEIYRDNPGTKNLFQKKIIELAKYYKLNVNKPFDLMPKELQHKIIFGEEDVNAPQSIIQSINKIIPQAIENFYSMIDCDLCLGKRLKKETLYIKIADKNITDISSMSIEQAYNWVSALDNILSPHDLNIASKIIKGMLTKLYTLKNMGLEYLTLDRLTSSLSGGEGQRIKLASQLGCGLTGITYVLDEPSIGLHPRDNEKLIQTLFSLKDLNNSVLVIEHDEGIIEQADYIIDIGLGAGLNGGKVISHGSLSTIINDKKSTIGKYIKDINLIPRKDITRKHKDYLTVSGLYCNNIKDITLKIPISCITCVTGVSGSGKSSMINYALKNIVEYEIIGKKNKQIRYSTTKNIDLIDKIISIDQKPIGKTSLSTPATYIGVFNDIREWFASLPESKIKGYKIGRFSFNVKGGRCEKCKGEGYIVIDMLFMPNTRVKCDKCSGQRYNDETLKIKYKNKNIKEILDLTVTDALQIFANIPKIKDKLQSLVNVGLEYMTLGQPAPSLSGGEAQRIKLSKELSKRSTGKTLYIFDEPTTGLHMEDIKKILNIIHKICDKGNTVIIIEHNLHVIKNADHIIDMGPDGGEKGGKIVFEGNVNDIKKDKASITGHFLARYLK